MEYKKERENKAADALSRAPHAQQLLTISSVQTAWIDQVVNSYQQDEHCLDLLTKLSIDQAAVQHHTLHNGILRYKGKLLVGNTGQLRVQLLHHFHKSALGGHSGERATYQRLKLIFYWPRM